MTALEEVGYVFEEAKKLLDIQEPNYGDSWKQNGLSVCMPQVFCKANYIRVQHESGRATTEKTREDLLDLMNWCAFSYHLITAEARK